MIIVSPNQRPGNLAIHHESVYFTLSTLYPLIKVGDKVITEVLGSDFVIQSTNI